MKEIKSKGIKVTGQLRKKCIEMTEKEAAIADLIRKNSNSENGKMLFDLQLKINKCGLKMWDRLYEQLDLDKDKLYIMRHTYDKRRVRMVHVSEISREEIRRLKKEDRY